MIGRRELLIGSAVAIGATAGGAAEACSLVASPNAPHDDRACRASLDSWVAFLNEGPDMPIERIAERADDMSVALNDEEMVASAIGERDDSVTETDRNYLFYKTFRLSGGRPDPRPIRISETHMIRRVRGRSTYQFTLDRYSYHPADLDGCNGLLAHDEYCGVDRTSYLAAFVNNRLRMVKPFPEWYLERRS